MPVWRAIPADTVEERPDTPSRPERSRTYPDADSSPDDKPSKPALLLAAVLGRKAARDHLREAGELEE